MKKIIYISTLFILTLTVKVKAQDDVIYGGFKLAPNFSVITDKADKWSSGIGYSLGYFEVLELNYKMNLQAEINYSRYVSFGRTLGDCTYVYTIPAKGRKHSATATRLMFHTIADYSNHRHISNTGNFINQSIRYFMLKLTFKCLLCFL